MPAGYTEGMERSDRRRTRSPRPPTRESVLAHAAEYLATRTSSRQHLRRLLLRRATRANSQCEVEQRVDAAHIAAWVDAALDDAERRRLIDDDRYAVDKARQLARRGVSDAGVRARLGAKGVAAAAVDDALNELGSRDARGRVAAFALARRRRLGPYRPEEERAEKRDSDRAILGRAGFPWGIATAVIAASLEDAEDALAGLR